MTKAIIYLYIYFFQKLFERVVSHENLLETANQ